VHNPFAEMLSNKAATQSPGAIAYTLKWVFLNVVLIVPADNASVYGEATTSTRATGRKIEL